MNLDPALPIPRAIGDGGLPECSTLRRRSTSAARMPDRIVSESGTPEPAHQRHLGPSRPPRPAVGQPATAATDEGRFTTTQLLRGLRGS